MDKKLVQGEREYGFAAVEHMSRGAKRKVYGALNRRSDRGGGRGGRGGGRSRRSRTTADATDAVIATARACREALHARRRPPGETLRALGTLAACC